jgi:enoyl-CoA hydratase/carnithine racemase
VTYQTILLDVEDLVATITLNRPERRNAWTKTMELELSAAMAACDRDDGIRAVILTGAGSTFSVGADLDDLTIPADSGAVEPDSGPELTLPSSLRKPVIAAIQGDAIGAGSTYPLGCDIRIVAESARMGFVFVKRGLMPGYGSMWALPRIVGLGVALELVLTGRLFTGTDAAVMGLAHRAVVADDVLPQARRLAASIARETGPATSALVKRLLWMSGGQSAAEFRRYEQAALAWCSASEESSEGIRSFLEKRDPRWRLHPSTDLPSWFDAGSVP